MPKFLEVSDTAAARAAIGANRGAVDLRDWDAIRNGQWNTALNCSYTSGQSTLSNVAFTAADVGKVVIVNGPLTGDTFARFMATIVSVSNGVATMDTPAPETGTGRVQWGFDCTDAINGALQSIASEGTPLEAFLAGHYRASQIVIPTGVTLRGAGWGSYGGTSGAPYNPIGTAIKQIPGSQKSLIVFDNASTVFSSLTDINLFGPEPNVTGHSATIGSGVSFRNADGTALIPQDGCEFSFVHSAYFPEHGFDIPNGCFPLTMNNCRAFYNGEYGWEYDGVSGGITQMLHLLNCSADGNVSGGARFKNVISSGSVAVTAFKSEAHTSDFYGVQTERWRIAGWPGVGDTQMSALIFHNCTDSPAVVNGVSHIFGGGSKAPGPAISITSTSTLKPRLVFAGVGVRASGTESNADDAVVLRDEVADFEIPRSEPSGVYPIPSPRIKELKDEDGNRVLAVTGFESNSTTYLSALGTSTPTLAAAGPSGNNVALGLRPQGTSAVQIYADAGVTPRIQPTGPDTNQALNLQSKGTSQVLINGVAAADVLDTELANELSSGESTLPRRMVNYWSSTGNQSLRLTYFTARKTETISQVRTTTGNTAAVGATLCRIGIYSEDGSGNLTLVASTANDTAMWSAASTAYTKSLSASFTKTRGQRYAVGILVDGTSTAPTIYGGIGLTAAEFAIAPRITANYGGQSDLPNTVNNGSLTGSSAQHYIALIP